MKFRATYIDPETKAEATEDLYARDRTTLEDSLHEKGFEVVRVEWLADELPPHLDRLELHEPSVVNVPPTPSPTEDKSLLGCFSICGLVLATMDFFLLGLLTPIGNFFLLFLCGLLLIVAQIRRR